MLPFHLPEQLLSPTESNSSSNPTTWHHLSWTFRSAPPGPVCSLLFNCPLGPQFSCLFGPQEYVAMAGSRAMPGVPQHHLSLLPFCPKALHIIPKGWPHNCLLTEGPTLHQKESAMLRCEQFLGLPNKYKSNHSCRDYSALGSKAKTNPSNLHFSVTAQIAASCSSSSPHESSSLPGSAFLPAAWDPHSRKHGARAAGWVAPVWAGAPAPTSSSSKINIGTVLGL